MPLDEPGSEAWILGPSINLCGYNISSFLKNSFGSSCFIVVQLLTEALLTVSLAMSQAVSHAEDLLLYFKTFLKIAQKM